MTPKIPFNVLDATFLEELRLQHITPIIDEASWVIPAIRRAKVMARLINIQPRTQRMEWIPGA